MTDASMLVVVGMKSEAAILGPLVQVVIGVAGLQAALAGGRGNGGILSFGICGALDPALEVGDLLIADGVWDDGLRLATDGALTGAFRGALPWGCSGDMAGSDVIVGSPAGKSSLARATGARAVDMESHAIARAATRSGLPFAVVRAVSDTAGRAVPLAAQAGFRRDGEADVGAVIRSLARRPWELPALVRMAIDTGSAFKSLRRAAVAWPPP